MIKFPPIENLRLDDDLIFIGGELNTENLLAAYSSGYFPMPIENSIGWFSPQKRGVLILEKFNASTSLKKSLKKFTTTVNKDFQRVVYECANPDRPYGWINQNIFDAYTDLHEQGWAHSVEVWQGTDIVGGVYGIAIDGLFAGESMFHTQTDASKVALLTLVEQLKLSAGPTFMDVQWLTPHLKSLGCEEISRPEYSELLSEHVKVQNRLRL